MTAEPLPVQRETSGEHAGVAIIRLQQVDRPVVVLDHPLIQRLEATIKSLPAETSGVILASASERAFVAGADLKSIYDLDDAQLHRYLKYTASVFALLSQLPCPTVAAINGAVLGGGLELAMHCDGLVAAPSASGKPYPVGLPEAGLQICPGWGGTNLWPARISPEEAIRRTAMGQPMNFDEARAAGMFDAVASAPDQLIPTAMTWLKEERARWQSGRRPQRDGAPSRWIGRPGRGAAVMSGLEKIRLELTYTDPAEAVFEAVDKGLVEGWEAALTSERDHLVRLRHTPPARAAIEAFFARSAGVKK